AQPGKGNTPPARRSCALRGEIEMLAIDPEIAIGPEIGYFRFNLNPVVGRGEVCGFWGAGQGATTRNGRSIPRSCNAAMCRKNCAIHPVAASPPEGERQIIRNIVINHNIDLLNERSTTGFRFHTQSIVSLRRIKNE
ncbi:MAG: hypothetical protein L0H15_11955, partial [Nitrosospira sp.]|nr:hypothetical protein [Nitrosospira sp.]